MHAEPSLAPQRTSVKPLNLLNIAVLLPCHNEATTIAQVVRAFQQALPLATVYVYDNASTDRTAEVARDAGAIVRFEPKTGKGNVIRRMFADIEADVYLMADGDCTYDAKISQNLIQELLDRRLDMVVGAREAQVKQAYRFGHRFGNRLFTKAVSVLFGSSFNDIFSGYRVFSRRFVKSFPALSHGFDIETELTVHSLEIKSPCAEISTHYVERPEGSSSKLNKYRDGFKISLRILLLLKEARPLLFFGFIAFFLAVIAVWLAIPLLETYLLQGVVPRIPTAILSTGIMLLAFLSVNCGIILDGVSRSRKERKYLHYLSLPWLGNRHD